MTNSLPNIVVYKEEYQ